MIKNKTGKAFKVSKKRESTTAMIKMVKDIKSPAKGKLVKQSKNFRPYSKLK